jgi:hypothetical protein
MRSSDPKRNPSGPRTTGRKDANRPRLGTILMCVLSSCPPNADDLREAWVAAGLKEQDLPEGCFDTSAKSRTLSATELSVWLGGLISSLDGVLMLPSGGVYFVPARSQDALDAIVGVLKVVTGHPLYRIPAIEGDETLNAILDAVSGEVGEEAAAMENELKAGGLDSRGYQKRIARAVEIEAKLMRHERALRLRGERFEWIRYRLDDLREDLKRAALSAR